MRSTLISVVAFWFFCAVIQCSETDRRDVHRIVIRGGGKRNRSHGHGHHHHKHSQHNSHEHDDKDHTNYSNHHRKFNRKTTTTEPPDYLVEETKVSPQVSDNWTPILSKDNQILQNPQKYDYKKERNVAPPNTRRTTTIKSKPLHEMIDLTTQYPQKHPKTIIENSSPKYKANLGTNSEAEKHRSKTHNTESHKKKKSTQHVHTTSTPGYEVYENVEEDIPIPHPSSFRLVPIFDESFARTHTISQEDNRINTNPISHTTDKIINGKKNAKPKHHRGSIKYT